ncbi:MAG: hypothetical protein HC845_08010 [Akkermansiaceae bacterium]|nr:hypothetical protein [Akkermansiaceae bacterium]
MVSSLKIAHATLSSSAAGGGISLAVRELAEAQLRHGLSPEIHSLADAGTDLGHVLEHIVTSTVSILRSRTTTRPSITTVRTCPPLIA